MMKSTDRERDISSGTQSASCQMGIEVFSSEVKEPGREDNHSPST